MIKSFIVLVSVLCNASFIFCLLYIFDYIRVVHYKSYNMIPQDYISNPNELLKIALYSGIVSLVLFFIECYLKKEIK